VGVFWRQFHSRLPAAEKTFATGLRLWKCFPMGKFHEVGGNSHDSSLFIRMGRAGYSTIEKYHFHKFL